MRIKRTLLISVSVFGLLGALYLMQPQPAGAQEGEKQDEPAIASSGASDTGPLSVSGFGETFDLTVIYPSFSPGETVELKIYLANLETNKPISNANITLTLTGPETEISITPVPVADSSGEYQAEASVSDYADYSFLVEVSTEDAFDLFSVDGFRPPDPQEEAEVDESSFSLGDYQAFFVLAGFMIVGFGAYSLGARERKTRQKRKNAEQQDMGEVT